MGLPDVEPLQAEVMGEVQRRAMQALAMTLCDAHTALSKMLRKKPKWDGLKKDIARSVKERMVNYNSTPTRTIRGGQEGERWGEPEVACIALPVRATHSEHATDPSNPGQFEF